MGIPVESGPFLCVPVPLYPTHCVLSRCVPVPLYPTHCVSSGVSSPSVPDPFGWDTMGLGYGYTHTHTGQSPHVPVPSCPSPTVSQTLRVPVILFPTPCVSQSHCVPDPACPSAIMSRTLCVPVPLCRSLTADQSRLAGPQRDRQTEGCLHVSPIPIMYHSRLGVTLSLIHI